MPIILCSSHTSIGGPSFLSTLEHKATTGNRLAFDNANPALITKPC